MGDLHLSRKTVPKIEMIPLDLAPLERVVLAFERIGAIRDEDVRGEALRAAKLVMRPVGLVVEDGDG